MSAKEFGEWTVMFDAEQLHPAADRLHHAQILAALHNGPLKRSDKQLWAASQFLDAEPWKVPMPESSKTPPVSVVERVAQINARFG